MAGQRKNIIKYIVFRANVGGSDNSFVAIGNGIFTNKELAYGAIMNDAIDNYDFNRIHPEDNDIVVSLPMQLSEREYRVDVCEIIPKYGNNNEINILLSYYILGTNNSKGENEECE